MIDLKKLESKIDELLENESSLELTRWLLNKRNENDYQIIGDGSFSFSDTSVINAEIYVSCTEVLIANSDEFPEDNYFLAA